jgi:hypothetical protein
MAQPNQPDQPVKVRTGSSSKIKDMDSTQKATKREGKPHQSLARGAVHPIGPFQGQNRTKKKR